MEWRRPDVELNVRGMAGAEATSIAVASPREIEPPVRERIVHALEGTHAGVIGIAGMVSSPDGAFIAVASSDNPAEAKPSSSSPGSIVRVQGQLGDTQLRVWAAVGDEPLFELVGANARISALAYSPDGQRIAALVGGSARVYTAT